MRFPDFRALDHLPQDIKAYEKWNVDICHEEVARLEGKEHVVAVDEDEDCAPCNTPDRKIWLESTVVCSFRAIEALHFFAAISCVTDCEYPTLRPKPKYNSQKNRKVKLIPNQPKNPPTVDRLTNQLRANLSISRGKWGMTSIYLKTCSEDSFTFMNERNAKLACHKFNA